MTLYRFCGFVDWRSRCPSREFKLSILRGRDLGSRRSQNLMFFRGRPQAKKNTILKPYNLGKTPLNWAYFVPKTLKYTKKNPACGGPKYTNFGQNRLYTLISKRTPPPHIRWGSQESQISLLRQLNGESQLKSSRFLSESCLQGIVSMGDNKPLHNKR